MHVDAARDHETPFVLEEIMFKHDPPQIDRQNIS